jgi:hypothetical protein
MLLRTAAQGCFAARLGLCILKVAKRPAARDSLGAHGRRPQFTAGQEAADPIVIHGSKMNSPGRKIKTATVKIQGKIEKLCEGP